MNDRTDDRPRRRGGEVSRRELFRLAFGRRERPRPAPQRGPEPEPEPDPGPTFRAHLRPPGALLETAFLAACEREHACVAACPYQALRVGGDGTPRVDPVAAPCVSCLDVPCSAACPSGALRPVTHPRDIRMGTARVDPDTCVAFAGEACRACFDGCPFPHRAIRLEGAPLRPAVSPTLCTGCGVCAHLCPEGAIVVAARQEPGAALPADERAGGAP